MRIWEIICPYKLRFFFFEKPKVGVVEHKREILIYRATKTDDSG